MSENLKVDIQREVFTSDHLRVNLLIENRSKHISKLSLHQSLVKRKFKHCDFQDVSRTRVVC